MKEIITNENGQFNLDFCFSHDNKIYACLYTCKLKTRQSYNEKDIILIEVKRRHPCYAFFALDNYNRMAEHGGKHITKIIREKLANETS